MSSKITCTICGSVVEPQPEPKPVGQNTIGALIDEIMNARRMHPQFTSLHHGYAVILEELDELWDEVKKRPAMRDKGKLRDEALQVAATAIRFVEELTDESNVRRQ